MANFRSIFPRKLALCPNRVWNVLSVSSSFFKIYSFSSYLLNIPKIPVTWWAPKFQRKDTFPVLEELTDQQVCWGLNRHTQKHKVPWRSGVHLMVDTKFTCPTNFQVFYFLVVGIFSISYYKWYCSVISEKPNYWDIHSFIQQTFVEHTLYTCPSAGYWGCRDKINRFPAIRCFQFKR